MDTNFILQFDKLIQENKGKRLMLHACCAPCASSVLEILREHFSVYVNFYNPNIQPQEEYEKRRREIQDFLYLEENLNLNALFYRYNDTEFEAVAKGYEEAAERGARCERCIRLRLENTALQAKAFGCKIFGTTLTVSPHKDADLINRIGLELQEKHGIAFLVSDFKKRNGYKRSLELSKEYGFYRQDYCGCLYAKIKR